MERFTKFAMTFTIGIGALSSSMFLVSSIIFSSLGWLCLGLFGLSAVVLLLAVRYRYMMDES